MRIRVAYPFRRGLTVARIATILVASMSAKILAGYSRRSTSLTMSSSLGIEACERDRGLTVCFGVSMGVRLPSVDVCRDFLMGRRLVLFADRTQILRFSRCSCLWHIIAVLRLEILRSQPLHACLKAGDIRTRMPRVLVKNFSTDDFGCRKSVTYDCFVIIGEHVRRVIAIIIHFLFLIFQETRPERQVLVDAFLTTLIQD